MAHWDCKANKIWHYPAEDMGNGWLRVDCGCSGGLQWGGEYPRECDRCAGTGSIWWHKKSKTFAQYPGGPLQGRGELTNLELNGNTTKPVKKVGE
jgi:hypothetical protein